MKRSRSNKKLVKNIEIDLEDPSDDDSSYDDEYDLDDDFIDNTSEITYKKTKINPKYKKKLKQMKKEIANREITMDQVFDLNLPINENIWFNEHIKIMKEMYEHTEDRYRIKSMIYDRFEQFKNIDIMKLNKIISQSGIEKNVISKIINSDHTDEVKSILYGSIYKQTTFINYSYTAWYYDD